MSRDPDAPGLLDALQRFCGSVLALLANRLELARLEADLALERLALGVLAALGAALLAAASIAALSAWLALALWERFGPAVLGLLALAYAVAAVLLVWWLRAWLAQAPPLFADTLAELQRDARRLRHEERS